MQSNYNTVFLLIWRDCLITHSDSPLLQLLEDSSDRDREGERELAASLLGVRGRDDMDVRSAGAGGVLGVVVLDQILQVARQQQRLPA